MPPYPVVIAEELGLFRDSLAALCDATGKFVTAGVAGTGDAAWSLIERLRPAIAVLDLSLPGLHPLEIARRLADQGGAEMGAPTRCILLSRLADRKSVIEALRMGAQGFVLKSDSRRHLLDCLEHVIEGGVYVSPSVNPRSLFDPSASAQPRDPLARLSSREHQVFVMLVGGVRPKEIAARLDLSPKTVDTYRASLMKKLDIHDVAGLVKFAIQRGLI
mgnify:CR=1 FL=1